MRNSYSKTSVNVYVILLAEPANFHLAKHEPAAVSGIRTMQSIRIYYETMFTFGELGFLAHMMEATTATNLLNTYINTFSLPVSLRGN